MPARYSRLPSGCQISKNGFGALRKYKLLSKNGFGVLRKYKLLSKNGFPLVGSSLGI